MFRAPSQSFGQMQMGGGQFSAPGEPNTPEFNALKAKRAELQKQMKTIPQFFRGGTNEFGQMPRPTLGIDFEFGPKYNPTQQETDDLARYKSILTQQNEVDSQMSAMMPNQGGLHQGPLKPPQEIIAGPQHRGDFGMGIQARPNPYAPKMGGGFGGQMGGGFGGGQGMQQFMQFMQTMMDMFQQFQGGGGGYGQRRGPGGFPQPPQQYGQYQPQPARLETHEAKSWPMQGQIRTRGPDSMMPQLRTQGPASITPRRMSNQFNPNNAFGGY